MQIAKMLPFDLHGLLMDDLLARRRIPFAAWGAVSKFQCPPALRKKMRKYESPSLPKTGPSHGARVVTRYCKTMMIILLPVLHSKFRIVPVLHSKFRIQKGSQGISICSFFLMVNTLR